VPIIFIIHLKTKELQIEWLEPFTMQHDLQLNISILIKECP